MVVVVVVVPTSCAEAPCGGNEYLFAKIGVDPAENKFA